MARPVRFAGALSIAFAVFAAAVCAQTPARVDKQHISMPTAVSAAKLSPKERGQLTRQFVLKWGAYMQRIYSVPVGTWAQRMVPTFVGADSTNFRNALKRDTFEGAMAELNGTGHRLGDEEIITNLASVGANTAADKPRIVARTLGALTNDLVFTPLQPCRIVDTRLTAAGTIAASSTRSFVGLNSSNFAGQGGSATDCGTFGLSATALALNVTAVAYAGTGHATVYPFGTALPASSSVNYNAGSFATNNGIIARVPNPVSTFDFTVWTAQTSHFVVDIVGYFAPPVATALDCATVSGTPTNVNAGAYASLPTLFCAANYTPVALSISAGENVLVADSYTAGNAGQIFVRSLSANAQNVTAKLMCCRVPGR
jgi:hypothetical protein